jgi:hypothetical protein
VRDSAAPPDGKLGNLDNQGSILVDLVEIPFGVIPAALFSDEMLFEADSFSNQLFSGR